MKLVLRLNVDRRAASALAAVALLGGAASYLSSENLTLSTSYPAPVGVYGRVLTTGAGGQNTVLARDGGSVAIGGLTPAHKLHVQGRVQATDDLCTDLAGGRCLSLLTPGFSQLTWAFNGQTSWRWPSTQADCPSGWALVGGGGTCQGSPGVGWSFINNSRPNGNGWYVACDTPQDQWNTAYAWASCVR